MLVSFVEQERHRGGTDWKTGKLESSGVDMLRRRCLLDPWVKVSRRQLVWELRGEMKAGAINGEVTCG